MQTNTLSPQFQVGMAVLSIVFWVLNWIPFLNIVTNAIYWVIWFLIFVYKYLPLIQKIAETGVQIGSIYTKIAIISIVAFALGEIPLVSIFPWEVIANFWINRLVKQLEIKIAEITKDVETLSKAWNKHKQAFPGRRRSRIQDPNSPHEAYQDEFEEEEEIDELQEEADEQQAINDERMARILAAEGEEDANKGNAKISQEYDRSLIEDPLDALNNKDSKTDEDVARLTRAAIVMRTGQLTPADRNDPVLMAAYNKHQAGTREFNPNTQQGYRFNVHEANNNDVTGRMGF